MMLYMFFSVWLITGSYPADINLFRSHTGKHFTNNNKYDNVLSFTATKPNDNNTMLTLKQEGGTLEVNETMTQTFQG